MNTNREPTSLDGRIVQRWRLWYRSTPGRRCWRHWTQRWPALNGPNEDEACNPIGSRQTDAMQASLVAIAQGFDNDSFRDEATMTLLVQLRPGLVSIARSRSFGSRQAHLDDVAAEVKATFFETLMRHDLSRRPEKIAANLLLDTRQRVVRTTPREPSLSDACLKAARPDSLPAPDTSSVSVRVALRSELAELPGVGRFGPSTAEVVYRAWFLEQSNRELATMLQVTPSLVSTRLHRVRQGLASRLAAA